MFGYYSAPSHFHQYHPSPSTSSYPSSRPSYYSSTPHASCSQQYHRAPRHYQIADSDDDDEDSSATYYEYLDAARRQQERRELLEAQAHRRAQEERAIQQARRAEAERRAEQIRQEREYKAYVERQLEARRQAHLRAQQQLQREREQEEQEERQRKIRQQQHKWQSDQDDFARAIFGQLGWHPLAQHAKERSAFPSAPLKPVVQPAPSSQEPAVKPLPQRTGRQQPRMTYMAAVTLIQSLAKEQISIRQRLRDLHRISDEFSNLKSTFVFPESLIFDLEKSTKDFPALAYTTQNLPLRAQEESLTRLLTKLDAVPSNGSERVKSERKALAKAIQAELDRLDAEQLEQWKKQTAGESNDGHTTAEPVIVGTTQAHQEQEVTAAPAPEQGKETQEAILSSTEEIATQAEDQADTTMAAEHTGTDETGSSGTSSEAIEPLVQMDIDQSAAALPPAEGKPQHIEVSGPLPVAPETIMDVQPSEQPSTSTEPSDGSIVEAISDMTSLAPEPVSGNNDTVTSDCILSVSSASTAPQQEQSRAPSHPQTQQHTEIEPTSQSTSSVSVTLLPATHGLDLLEVLPGSAEGTREGDEVGAESNSDSGSDTSFEML